MISSTIVWLLLAVLLFLIIRESILERLEYLGNFNVNTSDTNTRIKIQIVEVFHPTNTSLSETVYSPLVYNRNIDKVECKTIRSGILIYNRVPKTGSSFMLGLFPYRKNHRHDTIALQLFGGYGAERYDCIN